MYDFILEEEIHRHLRGETIELNLGIAHQSLAWNDLYGDILCHACHYKAQILIRRRCEGGAGGRCEGGVGRFAQSKSLKLGQSGLDSAYDKICFRPGIIGYRKNFISIVGDYGSLDETGKTFFNFGSETPMVPVFIVGIAEEEDVHRLQEVFISCSALSGFGTDISAGESKAESFSGNFFLPYLPLARANKQKRGKQ